MANKRGATDRWQYLVGRYLAGTCSREELDELLSLVKRDPHNKDLAGVLQYHWDSADKKASAGEVDWDLRFRTMMQQTEDMNEEKTAGAYIPRWRWYIAAASTVIIIVCGTWFWYSISTRSRASSSVPVAVKAASRPHEILPGGNHAVLTLANGTQVTLDSAQNGSLGVQANMRVIKIANGVLAYEKNHSVSRDALPLFNIISTPKGGQYQVVLPDGSKVWLNASSSLRFPTGFTGKQRNVELTGEAYFEIARDAEKPFKVKIGPSGAKGNVQEVEVLGTSFNVMAYSDESVIRTTLVDGAVKVRSGKAENILEPGQQAQSSLEEQGIRVIADADVAAAVAWKEGYFNFNKENIQTVMRQLSRWYDVDVSYVGKDDGRVFWGGMQRDLPLSAVFTILEKSGVQFSIEGKKVIVKM